VHGPVNPAAPADAALREIRPVLKRLQAGRLHPRSSIVAAVTRHQEAFVAALAREAGLLEQQVMSGEIGDPEQFLEELFRARHELLVVRTMAGQSREVYGRMAAALTRLIPVEAQPLVADLTISWSGFGAWPTARRTSSMG
jgi:magnesium transporter